LRRSAVVGGIVGPGVLIATWATLGQRMAAYSPVDDPISRLAAVDASTRWGMTAGMLALGAGVGLFARGLADEGQHLAATAAWITAASTVGIAATPLDSALGGNAHATAAAIAYASLAAVPALAGRELVGRGERPLGRLSIGVAAVCAAALATSVVTDARTGLWQRLGLTAGHLWIAAHAARGTRRGQAVAHR
jgi:hypothetical protein